MEEIAAPSAMEAGSDNTGLSHERLNTNTGNGSLLVKGADDDPSTPGGAYSLEELKAQINAAQRKKSTAPAETAREPSPVENNNVGHTSAESTTVTKTDGPSYSQEAADAHEKLKARVAALLKIPLTPAKPADLGDTVLQHGELHLHYNMGTASGGEILDDQGGRISPPYEGDFECEIWAEGKSGACRWNQCAKNPGHAKFIPASEFSPKHLPAQYRKDVFYKGIKAISDLTVRLKVGHVSKLRPHGYLFANIKGRSRSHCHTGSGIVHQFWFNKTLSNLEVPKDFTYKGSNDTGIKGALSAKYDHDESVEQKWEQIAGRLMGKEHSSRRDFGEFLENTTPLLKIIKGIVDYLDDDSSSSDEDCKLEERGAKQLFGFKSSNSTARNLTSVLELMKNPCVENAKIALKKNFRPPRKQPCIGEYERTYRRIKGIENRSRWLSMWDSMFGYFECGSKDNDKSSHDVSHKCIGFAAAASNNDDGVGDDGILNRSDEEAVGEKQENLGDDVEDSDEYYYDAKENHDDSDTDEDEDYVEDGTKTFGIVRPCPCPQCNESGVRKEKGYYVNVLTARHVVFDAEEAKHTEVDLFCDNEQEDGVKHLYGVDMHVCYHDGDLAVLMCVTHEYPVIRRIRKHLLEFAKRDKRMKAESDSPFAVICSHPHGHFQHITLGEWKERTLYRRQDNEETSYWTKYIYNTPTCPGSSGAAVLILGHKEGTLLLQSMFHPHHGHYDGELNRSGRFISIAQEIEEVCAPVRKRVLEDRKQMTEELNKKLKEKSKEEEEKWKRIEQGLDKLKDAMPPEVKYILDNFD